MISRNALGTAAERGELTWHAPEWPTIGPHGLLTHRARSVCLSERDALLAGVLIYNFNSEVADLELVGHLYPEGATHWTVHLCLHRLDRRLRRVGLRIVEVGDHSHALRAVDGYESVQSRSDGATRQRPRQGV